MNFQWPSEPGFPWKIQVYVVPVAWFSQLTSLFSCLYFFLLFIYLFFSLLKKKYFHCFFILDQLRSKWRRNTNVSIQHFNFPLLWNLLYEIFLVDRLGIKFEPMAIDHKCTCFIIDCLKFDWAIVTYLCSLIFDWANEWWIWLWILWTLSQTIVPNHRCEIVSF